MIENLKNYIITGAVCLILGFGAGLIQGRKASKPSTVTQTSEKTASVAASSDTSSKSSVGSLKAKSIKIKPNGEIVARGADLSDLSTEMNKLATLTAQEADKKSIQVEISKPTPLGIFLMGNVDSFTNLRGYNPGAYYGYAIGTIDLDRELGYQGFTLGINIPIQ